MANLSGIRIKKFIQQEIKNCRKRCSDTLLQLKKADNLYSAVSMSEYVKQQDHTAKVLENLLSIIGIVEGKGPGAYKDEK